MRTYAYFRVDKFSLNNNYIDYVINSGYIIPRNRFILEEAEINIPFKYRHKLINLINFTLESGDILLVNGIDCLGSNFNEIHSTISHIFGKEIRLICLEFSKKEINHDFKNIFTHFFKVCSDFENKFPANQKNINKTKNKVGRPEILNKKQQEEVLEKFKKGQSVYSLAKQYSVTRTVIQRLLSKSSSSFTNVT